MNRDIGGQLREMKGALPIEKWGTSKIMLSGSNLAELRRSEKQKNTRKKGTKHTKAKYK